VEPGDAAMSDLRAMRDLPMAHPTRAPHHLDAFALQSPAFLDNFTMQPDDKRYAIMMKGDYRRRKQSNIA